LRGLQSPPEIYSQLSAWGKFWDNVHHLIAPIICLTIGSFAGLTLLTKNSVLEEFDQLYATAARARGLSERKVLFKHILRNSLIPLITGFPARFVMMFFAGSVLIEKIFSLDGLGLLSYNALVERDYPLIISSMFVFTYIGLFCQLLSDIGYVIVDPRITFEEKS
jgi:microcin C transport system permease protein